MITPEGKFIKYDDYVELAENAEVVEIICPICKDMTRSEQLANDEWFCYECGNVYDI